MRMTPARTVAALVCGCVMLASAAAQAEAADSQSCMRMDRQVREAIASHADSANVEAATHERNQGQRACYSGFYRMGMDHYAIALKLLGEAPKS